MVVLRRERRRVHQEDAHTRSYTTRLLVRTWNVFHGNAVPPGEKSHLEDAVRLVAADEPGAVCLQEVPVWALERLGEWSGMRVFSEITSRPRLGPLPSTPELGRRLTEVDAGLLRSAFSGEANAILISAALTPLVSYAIELNSKSFRRAQAQMLRMDRVTQLAWGKARRVCHAVRARSETGRCVVIANVHTTGLPDDRVADAELFRAATFAEGLARPGEICVLAGDFNVWPARSRTLADLTGVEWGFSAPSPKLDQVLVRGAKARTPVVWPEERRRVGNRVLSDHAPVEIEIT